MVTQVLRGRGDLGSDRSSAGENMPSVGSEETSWTEDIPSSSETESPSVGLISDEWASRRLRAKKFGFVRKAKVSHYKVYNHRG